MWFWKCCSMGITHPESQCPNPLDLRRKGVKQANNTTQGMSVMTWKEIKLATLQKMFAAEGNNIPTDESVTDYVASMPQAANEALQLLSTANKFIIKTLEIAHSPVTNLLSVGLAKKVHTKEGGEISFQGSNAHSYYFEFLGKGNYGIYVGNIRVSAGSIDSKKAYRTVMGVFDNNGADVTIKISSDYPFSVKNVALYSAKYETAGEVMPFTEKIRYDLRELAGDFYQLARNEVYYEGENPEYARTANYFQEGDSVFLVDREMSGNYTIYYKAYPPTITASTEDDYELPLDSEVVVLLPLYMASQLYKDDDNGIATVYRNEFEVARELLFNQIPSLSNEHVVSESGWC